MTQETKERVLLTLSALLFLTAITLTIFIFSPASRHLKRILPPIPVTIPGLGCACGASDNAGSDG